MSTCHTCRSGRVMLEVDEALEVGLSTKVVGKFAVLAGLKLMVPVEMVLRRVITAEDMLSFAQG